MVKVNFSINVFYIYNINDNRKIPQSNPTKKEYEEKTELKFWNLLSKLIWLKQRSV